MESNFKNKGFTLIEIMIAVSIIILISAIVLLNYGNSGQQLALQRSANKLAQDLRTAEEMAISAAQTGGQVPQGGYGIYFSTTNSTQYILFADSNGNGSYDAGEAVGNPITMEKKIKITSPSTLTITYSPPDPTVLINNNPANTSATITISNDNNSKSIIVNKTGLIYVQ